MSFLPLVPVISSSNGRNETILFRFVHRAYRCWARFIVEHTFLILFICILLTCICSIKLFFTPYVSTVPPPIRQQNIFWFRQQNILFGYTPYGSRSLEELAIRNEFFEQDGPEITIVIFLQGTKGENVLDHLEEILKVSHVSYLPRTLSMILECCFREDILRHFWRLSSRVLFDEKGDQALVDWVGLITWGIKFQIVTIQSLDWWCRASQLHDIQPEDTKGRKLRYLLHKLLSIERTSKESLPRNADAKQNLKGHCEFSPGWDQSGLSNIWTTWIQNQHTAERLWRSRGKGFVKQWKDKTDRSWYGRFDVQSWSNRSVDSRGYQSLWEKCLQLLQRVNVRFNNSIRNFSEYRSNNIKAMVLNPTFVQSEMVRSGFMILPAILIGFVIMSITSVSTVLLSATYFQQVNIHKISLALFACICPLMASSTALGLLFFAGVRFSSILCVTPFLILSIGVDDAYLMLHSWQRVSKEMKQNPKCEDPVAYRLSLVSEWNWDTHLQA